MKRSMEATYKNLLAGLEMLKEENDTLFKRLKRSRFQILKLLIDIVEEIDPYTKGHSLKVYRHAVRVARKLRLGRKAVHAIGIAALLHDMGKIVIDKNILNKKGKLTESEYAKVKVHPIVGAKLAGKIESLKASSDHILYHHTNFCGGGYPKNKFKLDEIPIGARVIAVADSYDAMTSGKALQKGIQPRACICRAKEVCRGSIRS